MIFAQPLCREGGSQRQRPFCGARHCVLQEIWTAVRKNNRRNYRDADLDVRQTGLVANLAADFLRAAD